MQHKGWVNVNWKKIEQDAVSCLDQDGDNKITEKDFKIMYRKGLKYFSYKIPSAGAFAFGTGLGIKYLWLFNDN